MMSDYRQYLLRTDAEVAAFMARYAGFIEKHADAYVSWIDSLPFCEKVPYLVDVPERAVPAVIGLICLLHDTRQVNIQFSEDMMKVSRQPRDFEEWKEWVETS